MRTLDPSPKPPCIYGLLPSLCLTLAALAPGFALAESAPPPPYVGTQTNGVQIEVIWEESAVRKALPPGIKPVPSMAGGIVIYSVGQAYGLGPYSSAYFYVETEGMDSPDGTKAHWMLQGVYGPDPKVSAAMSTHYSLPVRNGTSKEEMVGGTRRYTAMINGRVFITADIKPNATPCEQATAFEHYPGHDRRTGKMVLLAIPETGQWCVSEFKDLKIDVPAGDPFAPFKVKSVTAAGEFRDWSFSFTHPQTVAKK